MAAVSPQTTPGTAPVPGTPEAMADTRPAAARPPVRLIQDDAEALAVARELAPRLAQGSVERDLDRVLPWEEVELLALRGLGGITVRMA